MNRAGQTVDFMLRAKRDVKAAKAFFRKALKHQGKPPKTISLDGYAASHAREWTNGPAEPLTENESRSTAHLNPTARHAPERRPPRSAPETPPHPHMPAAPAPFRS
ncbi:DDE-type integrase/transposase/recombinase [Paraburkholderia sp. HC6.4b]|uniref:DDE-type integrase/transposase/recombinase n=1 Tax=unclassified Paraburkholderia TaxID=2615204 RepID=UPI00390665CD